MTKLFWKLRLIAKNLWNKVLHREIASYCKRCGIKVRDFSIDNKWWKKVIKDKYNTVCYHCFCDLSAEANLPSIYAITCDLFPDKRILKAVTWDGTKQAYDSIVRILSDTEYNVRNLKKWNGDTEVRFLRISKLIKVSGGKRKRKKQSIIDLYEGDLFIYNHIYYGIAKAQFREILGQTDFPMQNKGFS